MITIIVVIQVPDGNRCVNGDEYCPYWQNEYCWIFDEGEWNFQKCAACIEECKKNGG